MIPSGRSALFVIIRMWRSLWYQGDQSRDRLLLDAGYIFVEPIAVAETDNRAELDLFIRRLLDRPVYR